MKFLIDADTYIYKIAYFNRHYSDPLVVHRQTERYIENIFKSLTQYGYSGDYLFLLTSSTNYRNKLTSDYKANRKEKMKWVVEIYKIVRDLYNTLTINDYEADDLAATLMKKSNYKDIIVHADKDLLQIPGTHVYRDELTYIDHVEAYTLLMTQVLTGDSTDNIKGIPGIGKVTAKRLLKNQPLIDMQDIVIKTYIKHYKNDGLGLKHFWLNYNLIKLKTDIDV